MWDSFRAAASGERGMARSEGRALLEELEHCFQREGGAVGATESRPLSVPVGVLWYMSRAERGLLPASERDGVGGLLRSMRRQLLFVSAVKLEGARKATPLTGPSSSSFPLVVQLSGKMGVRGAGETEPRRDDESGSESESGGEEEDEVDLGVFPALQHLAAQGVRAGDIGGILHHRAQLKSLRLEGVRLRRLSQLLLRPSAPAPGEGATPDSSPRAAGSGAADAAAETADEAAESAESLATMPPVMATPVSWQWRSLRQLSLRGCGLKTLDASLRTVALVEEMDVSDNVLAALPPALAFCTHLEVLDMSNNSHLGPALPTAPACLGALRVLKLRNCGIRSCLGIDRLYSLERLDLGENLVESFPEANRVASLPFLKSLCFAHCPIASAKKYRLRVLALMHPHRDRLAPGMDDRAKLAPAAEAPTPAVLDGAPPSAAEAEKLAELASTARRALTSRSIISSLWCGPGVRRSR